jgi:o-succinylbenzoate synthase
VALDLPLDVRACRLSEAAVPLAEPFRISGGTMAVRRSLIIELEDADGARGRGESAPFAAPFYSEETLSSARACILEHLTPRVEGRRFAHLGEAIGQLTHGIRGNHFAIAGVETALWDLAANKAGVPLAALLAEALERMNVPAAHRERRGYVESGAALGIPEGEDALERLAAQARHWLARGVHRVKIKVQPGWDVAPVRAVRRVFEELGRPPRVWADANGAYDRVRDAEALRALDNEGLELLEQPLDPADVLGMLSLGHHMKTPICLDESLHDDRAAELFLASDAPGIWNLKVQRVGGLLESLRIYARAVAAGVPLWGGTMPETGVGSQAMLALGSFAGFTLPTDLTASDRWYVPGTDLIDIVMDDAGRIAVPG